MDITSDKPLDSSTPPDETEPLLDNKSTKAPGKQKVIEKVEPLIQKGKQTYDTVKTLYDEKAKDKVNQAWEKAKPYNPEEFLPLLGGLFLVLYGSCFSLTIACVESFRVSGWAMISTNCRAIWKSLVEAKASMDKDSPTDSKAGFVKVDGSIDGSKASDFLGVLVKAVQPDQVAGAMSGVYVGLVAVIAAIRAQAAIALALGIKIGDIVFKNVEHLAHPKIAELPEPVQKWAPMALDWACKGAAMTLALMMTRTFQAVYCCLQGATFAAKALRVILKQHVRIEEGDVYYIGIQVVLFAFGMYQSGKEAGMISYLVLFIPFQIEKVLQML